MTSLELWIRRLSVALVLTVLAVQPIEARASAVRNADKGELRMEDKRAEKRLVVTVGPISSPGAAGEAIRAPLAAGGRIGRSAIAHRLRVELVDSAQRPVHGVTVWEARLFAGSAAQLSGSPAASLASFDHFRATVDLPKPLGYRLEVGDSVLVVATIGESDSGVAGDVYLVVTIEYEPLDGPVSRLAVVPVDLGPSRVDSAPPRREGEQVLRRSWDWTPHVGGRILALTGVPVESAHELVLDDPATGTVLWRTTNRQMTGAGFVRPSQCVRLGVLVEAGRGYRLTAILPDSSASAMARDNDAIRALILPNRAPTDLVMEGK